MQPVVPSAFGPCYTPLEIVTWLPYPYIHFQRTQSYRTTRRFRSLPRGGHATGPVQRLFDLYSVHGLVAFDVSFTAFSSIRSSPSARATRACYASCVVRPPSSPEPPRLEQVRRCENSTAHAAEFTCHALEVMSSQDLPQASRSGLGGRVITPAAS